MLYNSVLKQMPQKRMECFRLLFNHLVWIEHQLLEWHKRFKGGREFCERWWEVVLGVRKLIHHIWLAKGFWVRVRLLCWGFKGVQEEIPSEEASTHQIGSVAFPPGQCTNQQIHLCHRLFDQDGHQDRSSLSLYSRPCFLWLLVIS